MWTGVGQVFMTCGVRQVGALNKIPSSILGIFIFCDPINWLNLAGVAIGLAGGIIFRSL